MNVEGKRVLVVGLARSGFAVARALARRGAVVMVTDKRPPAEFHDLLPELLKDKVGVELGSQREETFLRHQMIIISPGVPWDLPQLQVARERMIPIYPEVEAASWFLEGTLVGVTGSNGKTTTTSLLGDMLKSSGFPTFVGGNIGNALSSAVDHAQPGTRFVTELSSFQLEGIHEFRPHVAVMLNLSPNHLDRHANLEAYAQAKRQIFRNQGGQDYAVLNADDPWVAGLREGVPSRPVFFSRRRELADGVFVSAGKICYRVRHLERVLFETRDVSLKGDFNLEDVLAATTAACLLGADFTAIRRAVRGFQAVEHRLEFVQAIAGVDFYNNSKATSVDATLKSLEAFDHDVHLVMGGKDKGAPYAPLLPLIKDRVREVLVIGAAAPIITQQLAGSTRVVQAGDIATAVYQAFARSRPGDTVLLAPACSSFDQFKDFEERGRVFKELVKRLANDVAIGRVIRDVARDTGHGIRDTGQAARDTSPGTGDASETSGTGRPGVAGQSPGAVSPVVESNVPLQLTPLAAKPGHRDVESATPPGNPGVRNLASEILNVKSGTPAAPNAESGVPVPEPPTPSRESRIPPPVSHVPLTYVYEVDALETAEPESQVAPEDEPVVSLGQGSEEAVEDEVLPFEAREQESGVHKPDSKAGSPESGVSDVESHSEYSPRPKRSENETK